MQKHGNVRRLVALVREDDTEAGARWLISPQGLSGLSMTNRRNLRPSLPTREAMPCGS